MNNVTTDPNNVTVSGGALNLRLASSSDGDYVAMPRHASSFATNGEPIGP
jgi:hypothetical protein